MKRKIGWLMMALAVIGCDTPDDSVVVDTDPEVFTAVGEEGAMIGMTDAHNVVPNIKSEHIFKVPISVTGPFAVR